MLYAAIDIHKHAFQAAALDPERAARWSRSASRRIGRVLARWAEQWRDRVPAVAIEATTGWRWEWGELGFAPTLSLPPDIDFDPTAPSPRW